MRQPPAIRAIEVNRPYLAMPDFDVLIRGAGRDLAINDGKFVEIGQNLRGSAGEEIDATGLLVLPGVIDAHVHFNEPGRTDWEGFETGSRACAAGGTTTVFEMPLNAHPPTTDGASFDLKRTAAEASSLVDFGLWGGLVPGNLKELETLRDRGVVGLKAFMCNSGIADFPAVDLPTLREGMLIAAHLDLLVAVHAESEETTARLTGEKQVAGKATVQDFLDSRPVEAELDAIEQAITCADETGCRLHIVHVSCGRAVALVAEARARGIDVTCETCPHYLVLTEADMRAIGPAAKCAPPLRSAGDQKELWKQLADVTTIGSDHSPSPPEMKQSKNFFDVWGGISGAQHLLGLLLDLRLAEGEIVRLTSESVAERFRVPGKSGLRVGQDADLALVDPGAQDKITAESLHYRHRQSAYLGRDLRSRIVRTILRGQTIYRDGVFAKEPRGKLVRPGRGD
jgi:allantoinase